MSVTPKPINRSVSSEFHAWIRNGNAPGCVVTDVDTWAIVVADARRAYRPLALYELKRSYMAVEVWRPFVADRHSYAALLELGRAAGVPVYVVYFVKGQEFELETELAVYRLDDAPDYRYEREVITVAEFKRRFPYPLAVLS